MIIPPKSAHFSAGFTHDLCQQPSLDHVLVEQKLPGVNPEGLRYAEILTTSYEIAQLL